MFLLVPAHPDSPGQHTPVYRPFVRDYPGEPEGKTNLHFTEQEAVASAGPYASLHLAPDR